MAEFTTTDGHREPQAEPRHDRGALALAWFGILAPPAAWAAQLLLSEAFAEVGCEAGGFSWMSALLIAIAVVALAIALTAGIVAFVRYRRAPSHDGDPTRLERMRFMTLLGCMSSGLFVILIILGGIVPHLVMSSCAAL